MSEVPDSRRPRPKGRPSGASDDVYELDGGDELEPVDDDPSSKSSPFDDPAELGEEDESPHAKRPGSSPAPLPRIWKAESEPDSEPSAPAPAGKTSAKREAQPSSQPPKATKKTGSGGKTASGGIERIGSVSRPSDKAKPQKSETRGRKASDDKGSHEGEEKKGVLKEETPNLDTYEARQTARVLVGIGGVVVLALIGMVIWRAIPSGRAPEESNPAQEAPVVVAPVPSRESVEQEARSLFERARDVARKGNATQAVAMLTKVTSAYPNTAAARDAKEALDHPKQNLPLFLDRPAVVATSKEAPPAPNKAPEPKPPVVQATEATPTMPNNQQEVGLVLPANKPESQGVPTELAAPTPPEPSIGHPLPTGFRSKPGTTVHASGWPLEIIGDRDPEPMVLVPGGQFIMGRDDGDPSERPAHAVKVSTFYVDVHEVTVRQYDLFQKEAGRRGDRDRALAREPAAAAANPSEDSPVVRVSAKDAKDYAGWAHKRLPTEAQWEYAARGNDGRLYPWGTLPPDAGSKRESGKIGPVMSFASDVSPFGAYDMAGNAWEWTKDYYDPRYFHLIKSQIAEDPAGPVKVPASHELVIKGFAKNWIATKREGVRYDKRLPALGFRCVLPVEGVDNAFQTAKPATAAPEGIPVAPGQPGGPPPF